MKSVEPIEHLDKGCFREAGMSKERSSKSKDKNEKNDFSGDKVCHDTQNRFLEIFEINERKDIESFEGKTDPQIMSTRPDESCIGKEAENLLKTQNRISKDPAESQSCTKDRLTVEEFKTGNQHLKLECRRIYNSKQPLIPNRMI